MTDFGKITKDPAPGCMCNACEGFEDPKGAIHPMKQWQKKIELVFTVEHISDDPDYEVKLEYAVLASMRKTESKANTEFAYELVSRDLFRSITAGGQGVVAEEKG